MNIEKLGIFFKFAGINKHNLHNQAVNIPKKSVTVFTGVSGSGKSSLAKWIETNQKAIYITQKIVISLHVQC